MDFIVISLRIAASSELSPKPLSIIYVWQSVGLDMLFQVPLLCEFLVSNIAHEGLYPSMCTCVIKHVPRAGEFFSSSFILTFIDDQWLTIKLFPTDLGIVREALEFFKVSSVLIFWIVVKGNRIETTRAAGVRHYREREISGQT